MNAAPRTEVPAAADDLPPVPAQLAAIDLGSNSFHLVIGKVVDGHVDIVDRLREPVRLAAGLDDRKRLGRDAIESALDCLRRFAQRLRGMPEHAVKGRAGRRCRTCRPVRARIRAAASCANRAR